MGFCVKKVMLATALCLAGCGGDKLENEVRANLLSAHEIASLKTVELAELRQVKNTVCGKISFDRIGGGGRSGFVDFYMVGGVVVVEPEKDPILRTFFEVDCAR